MAVHWSRESIVANHQDLQANTMALSWNGEFAVLAGRRSVAVINLDKPSEVAKRISRKQLKYGVSAAEWNPTSHAGQYFVVAVGEKADIFSWREGTLTNENSLKAHTRNVTDLNWHKSDPTLLATCSIDTFIHIWDTRETRKPIASPSAITGASQVKWSKLDPYMLASGHDCNIRIWDRRKISQPFCYITAHLSKIHCIDWSPNQKNCLVSSNDSTVKFFDIKNPKKEEIFINAQSPVWRARYTPFGEGIVTVVVPPLRRGENALLLWSILDRSGPVHTFHGHSDVVLEFDWRNGGSVNNGGTPQTDYQLVTWSRDHTLRIWKIDPQLLKVCGQDMCEDEVLVAEETLDVSDTDTILAVSDAECNGQGQEIILESGTDTDSEFYVKNSNGLSSGVGTSEDSSDNSITASTKPHPTSLPIAREGAANGSNHLVVSHSPICNSSFIHEYSSISSSNTSRSSYNHLSQSLQQEFASLNSLRENSHLNSLEIITDEDKRTCQVSVRYGLYMAVLYVMFPLSYPRQSPPSFKFLNGTNLDVVSRGELLKSLKNSSAQALLKKRKGCLELCIRNFIYQIKTLNKGEERTSLADTSLTGSALNIHLQQLYGGQQDFSIPFPRTSGARFCSSGKLVCFARPTLMGIGGPGTGSDTPRSLSALRANIKNPMGNAGHTSPKYNYIYAIGQSPSTDKDISVSDFYYQVWKLRNKKGKNGEEAKIRAGNVIVYDISALMPISKDIASSYGFGEDDILTNCNKNRDAVSAAGRKDLVQVWSSAALIATSLKLSSEIKDSFPLAFHPMGRKLITSLIDHYLKCYDVQTAAMLCCVFGEKPLQSNYFSSWKNKTEQTGTGGSPYKTIHGINTESFDISRVRHCRSNSEGSLAEVSSRPPLEQVVALEEANTSQEKEDASFLDPMRTNQYNEIRRAYADILYQWDLLEQRAMVTKYIQNAPPPHVGVDFQIECHHCGQSCRHPICSSCKKYSFMCAVCHLPVRGCSNFCISCGHGGHTYHIDDWFMDNAECPTGCGCQCLKEMEDFVR